MPSLEAVPLIEVSGIMAGPPSADSDNTRRAGAVESGGAGRPASAYVSAGTCMGSGNATEVFANGTMVALPLSLASRVVHASHSVSSAA